MSIVVPVQVDGSAAGWTLHDFLELVETSPPAAGGRAMITFDQLDPDEMLLVDHAVVVCTSTTATTVRLYADRVDPLAVLDGSAAGNFDVAEWPNGLQLRPSTSLIVVWDGCSAGAVGTITLQTRSLRR